MFTMIPNEASIIMGRPLDYLVALDTLADVWSVARVAGFVGRGLATARFEDGARPITSGDMAEYASRRGAARLAECEAHEARYRVRFAWLEPYRQQVTS